MGQAVATSVDLVVLDFGSGGFGVADFSGSGSASATVGKAMAYVAALGQKAAFCWVSHRRKAGWQASVGRGRGS